MTISSTFLPFLRISLTEKLGRKRPVSTQTGNDRLQYVAELQGKVLNGRVVVRTGHPSKLLRYFGRKAGMCETHRSRSGQ